MSTSTVGTARPSQRVPARNRVISSVQLFILSAAVLLVYRRYIFWMVDWWSRSEYYGHGFLIPIVTGYLIWRQREGLRELPRKEFRAGIKLIAASLLLHIAATFGDVHFLSGFALVGTIFGLVVWLGGRSWGRALAFPIAFLLFMVPLDRLLIDQLAQPLQVFSAQMGGRAVAAIGTRIAIEGTMIHTPVYTFEVAIPCSGLKSMIAMTALAALFAHLLIAPRWKKLLLFAVAVPVALLANTVRIFVTVVLGTTLGPAMAEGFFHSVSGILVFMLGLAGLFGAGRLLGCLQLREDI